MVSSRELHRWPNEIRMAFYQQMWCGHVVAIFSNREKILDFSKSSPHGSPVLPDLKESVMAMGCIKCVEPVEPLDYQHKGSGGFLKNYAEFVPFPPRETGHCPVKVPCPDSRYGFKFE